MSEQELVLQEEEVEELSESDKTLLSLSTKQQRFIHMYITGQYEIKKIAQLLEIHPNTCFNWLKRKDVKLVVESMQLATQDVVSAQLKAMTLKAAGKLNALIDSPIDGVALQAVKDVLDRSGHKAKQEIKVDKTVTTVEQKLASLIDSTIVEAEYEVVDGD
jgi:predicted DNA-binding protein YlxM (UPF0122 family)